ncbi:MAG: DUF1836 domain-containing protein [Clostridia bacterium]|nr:DUF1836 domain-containing protein [Clostridia bacterium]
MDEINDLIKGLESFIPAQLDRMPDIELYKDQVITYLKKELALFQGPLDTEIITSSMINNYVKDGIVPRPVKKRYSKAQLAPLIMACILKRALSIKQIKTITSTIDAESGKEVYERFCDTLSSTIREEIEKLTKSSLTVSEMALSYSLKASIDATIADGLLKLAAGDNDNK